MEAKVAMQGGRASFWFTAVAIGFGLLVTPGVVAHGQVASPEAATGAVQPPSTLAAKLQSMASRAGVVFSGQVISIERREGIVEVTFRVEQTVLGAPGDTYVLREWAGLWAPGVYRYTVGQRALLFASLPGSSGLSSPVDGAEGVVPVLVQGADAPALLDIRRLAASLVRTPGAPLPDEAEGAIELSDAIRILHPPLRGVLHVPVRIPLPGSSNAPLIPVTATAAEGKTGPILDRPAVAPVSPPLRVRKLLALPVPEQGNGR